MGSITGEFADFLSDVRRGVARGVRRTSRCDTSRSWISVFMSLNPEHPNQQLIGCATASIVLGTPLIVSEWAALCAGCLSKWAEASAGSSAPEGSNPHGAMYTLGPVAAAQAAPAPASLLRCQLGYLCTRNLLRCSLELLRKHKAVKRANHAWHLF